MFNEVEVISSNPPPPSCVDISKKKKKWFTCETIVSHSFFCFFFKIMIAWDLIPAQKSERNQEVEYNPSL
jgi:hypothetical protein